MSTKGAGQRQRVALVAYVGAKTPKAWIAVVGAQLERAAVGKELQRTRIES